jgi:aminoglycoside phosphotransferase (APT) family kinase protein
MALRRGARTGALRSRAVTDPRADAAPAIARPRTSTRDRGALRVRLERWLGAKLEGAAVSPLGGPATNGMSSETLLFEASWREGGAAKSAPLVARLAPDPAAVPVFPTYDMERQFRVMRALGEANVLPLPRVLWCETDPAPLGAPFLVMERVAGEVPPDIPPYTFGQSWLSRGTPEQRARLQEGSVALLAALFGLERPAERFAFLASARPGATPLRRFVAELRGFYDWVAADGLRSPLLERCFAWLDASWPRHEGPTVLSWGDARIGNVLYRDFGPAAALDWEMAALGPPELDLGWMVALHRFFDDLAVGAGMPGMPGLLRRDDVAASYEKQTGYAPRDLDFYTLLAALRHGIVMFRIARRMSHFGEMQLPPDVDDMIAHRRMLERMLTGEYWC